MSNPEIPEKLTSDDSVDLDSSDEDDFEKDFNEDEEAYNRFVGHLEAELKKVRGKGM
ncbi:MAG: hypothetical protein V7K88_13515 [Nostoc sp.]|uniref:hypothetical protein n=1 Tax=Nostoc sp. TaxID=1180 RepID=UPI002FF65843